MYRNHLAAALLTTLAALSPLAAQQTTTQAADSVAKPAAQQLRAVRVVERATRKKSYNATTSRTATKTATPLRNTPQSVSVVTQGLIADKSMQSMTDVVAYLPGISMATGESHHDAPMIRGNSTTADFFVDGIRDDAQYMRDLYNVERVEALKGSNAMVFGRGGGGGVINRVMKEAAWAPLSAFTLEGGSNDHKRSTLDVSQPFGDVFAARVNGMAEQSGGFRQHAKLHRYGVSPTATLLAGSGTTVRVDYEHFDDARNVDRGIPSLGSAPAPAPVDKFFGDPDISHSFAHVNGAGIVAEHALGGGFSLRSHAYWATYDKFYQNVFAGSAVSAAAGSLSLSGYNSVIRRDNLIDQTELTGTVATGPVRHTLLAGAELSRERTTNFRNTAFFSSGTSTSLTVPFAQPALATSAIFRQSASDADNNARADVGALYLQDQVALSDMWQAVVGVRGERFAMRFHNNRTGENLQRDDRLVSPRLGLVFKPAEAVSLYGSSSVAYLPSSGDQFQSLTVTTQTLEPERFINYELGAKWDVGSALSLTAAAYRLDRTNSQAPDPVNPGRVVLTGARRTTGFELGASGSLTDRWSLAGGYASQRAVLTGTTTAAPAGATIQLVPSSTLSLWNKVQITSAFAAGVCLVHQTKSYAAIDNTVVLPGFTRYDGGLFFGITPNLRAQLNVENLFDVKYFPTSQGNNNIMPGAPRTLRLSLTAGT
jgi:catecholate siderophore receptor